MLDQGNCCVTLYAAILFSFNDYMLSSDNLEDYHIS